LDSLIYLAVMQDEQIKFMFNVPLPHGMALHATPVLCALGMPTSCLLPGQWQNCCVHNLG